jgi:hypothetical protein
LLPGSGTLGDGIDVEDGVVAGKLFVLGVEAELVPGTVRPPAAPLGPKLGAPLLVPLVPLVPLGPLVPFDPGIPLLPMPLGPGE